MIVRKLSRDWCAGYADANPAGPNASSNSTELELLDSSGKLLRIAWDQIKWVCYVRELGPGENPSQISGNDSYYPERLLRRSFSSRPRIAGLWLRITLRDGDELEGVAANDRSLVDGAGLLLIPPDTRSNTQRIFVPRSAIRELTVLAVISPSGSSRHKTTLQADPQPELFENDAE